MLHSMHTTSSGGDQLSDDVTAVAPDLPADFWEQAEIRSPLLSQHFGRFLRAYRSAQSPKVKQADLAAWLGITQGQLSKLERSPLPFMTWSSYKNGPKPYMCQVISCGSGSRTKRLASRKRLRPRRPIKS